MIVKYSCTCLDWYMYFRFPGLRTVILFGDYFILLFFFSVHTRLIDTC